MAEAVNTDGSELEHLENTSEDDQIQNEPDSRKADSPKLTAAQRARIERNRQRALLLKQSRIVKRSLASDPEMMASQNKITKKVVDTGGGFLLEEVDTAPSHSDKVIHQEGALLVADIIVCEECDKAFTESYLFDNFEATICDKCKDLEEKHAMITKTEAKNRYLLKDADLDVREPPLKFIEKKNPRHSSWGTMKLYLELQVAERAAEVWGTDEKLEEERTRRTDNRDQAKQKKFNKRVQALRKAVRSSLYTKDTSEHEHTYGPETYNEADDVYTKECTECGQSLSYEKM